MASNNNWKKTSIKVLKNILYTGSSLVSAGIVYLSANPEVLAQAKVMTSGTKYAGLIVVVSAMITAYSDYKKHK